MGTKGKTGTIIVVDIDTSGPIRPGAGDERPSSGTLSLFPFITGIAWTAVDASTWEPLLEKSFTVRPHGKRHGSPEPSEPADIAPGKDGIRIDDALRELLDDCETAVARGETIIAGHGLRKDTLRVIEAEAIRRGIDDSPLRRYPTVDSLVSAKERGVCRDWFAARGYLRDKAPRLDELSKCLLGETPREDGAKGRVRTEIRCLKALCARCSVAPRDLRKDGKGEDDGALPLAFIIGVTAVAAAGIVFGIMHG